MIPIRIEAVDRAALDALIDNAVPEAKTIEYKQALPGKADSTVDPVVATVTSFANTDGGDLLLGVTASKGVPLELPRIEIENWDQESQTRQRWDRAGRMRDSCRRGMGSDGFSTPLHP